MALFLQLLSLEQFTYHMIIEGGYLKCLCLIIGVGGGREVEMLIYENILGSEAHLVGSEIRINGQQNCQNLRYALFSRNNFYKDIGDKKL